MVTIELMVQVVVCLSVVCLSVVVRNGWSAER